MMGDSADYSAKLRLNTMRVYLIDGTYELFRHYFGVPSHRTAEGAEVAATRAVLSSLLGMLEEGVTHLGVATDHVIESFRNDLWPGYKSSAGIARRAAGPVRTARGGAAGRWASGCGPWSTWRRTTPWPSAAAVAADDPEVDQVVICTPDKDLGQCVRDGRVVQLDRRKRVVLDEAGVIAKFGVSPTSIPDYLALVGDSSDGFPGLPGWGAKSTALVLAHYGTIEQIPDSGAEWEVSVRGGAMLAATLAAHRDEAMLFKDLATLRVDRSLLDIVDQLRWRGPTADFGQVCVRLDAEGLARRADRLVAKLP